MSRLAESLVQIIDKFDCTTPRDPREIIAELWKSGEYFGIVYGLGRSFSDVVLSFVREGILEQQEGGLVLTALGRRRREWFDRHANGAHGTSATSSSRADRVA